MSSAAVGSSKESAESAEQTHAPNAHDHSHHRTGRNIAIRQMGHRRTLHHRSNHGVILFSALRTPSTGYGPSEPPHAPCTKTPHSTSAAASHADAPSDGHESNPEGAIQQNLTATGRNITSNHPSRVDLPAPLGPISETTSSAETDRDTSFRI